MTLPHPAFRGFRAEEAPVIRVETGFKPPRTLRATKPPSIEGTRPTASIRILETESLYIYLIPCTMYSTQPSTQVIGPSSLCHSSGTPRRYRTEVRVRSCLSILAPSCVPVPTSRHGDLASKSLLFVHLSSPFPFLSLPKATPSNTKL